MSTICWRISLLISIFLVPVHIYAQYPPPAGQPGTTAMYKDSSAFIGWASTCSLERGYINISDTSVVYNGFNKASYGSYLYGYGPADELVASLGDHGSALLGFDIPVVNRVGPDFAVFENSFGDKFLELAFVEVSSDGLHFVRFPSVSLTPDNQQVNTFDTIDATKINNLAGKYRHGYGTPFDLEDIRDSAGIDLNNITFIRVIDAVGCIQDPWAGFDSQGHKINDPWPTPFDTGGFDFDAIGVIHNKTEGLGDDRNFSALSIYPNPVVDNVTFDSQRSACVKLIISGPAGNRILETVFSGKSTCDMSAFPAGIYLASIIFANGTSVTKKLIKY